jgi:hypothetical protein
MKVKCTYIKGSDGITLGKYYNVLSICKELIMVYNDYGKS